MVSPSVSSSRLCFSVSIILRKVSEPHARPNLALFTFCLDQHQAFFASRRDFNINKVIPSGSILHLK